MAELYETVIGMVEKEDVTEESDALLQKLGEEVLAGSPGSALLAALRFLAGRRSAAA